MKKGTQAERTSISTRVNAEERALIEAGAKLRDEKPTAYMRKRAVEAAKRDAKRALKAAGEGVYA